MRLPPALRRAATAALDLVVPARCLACEGDDPARWSLCRPCLALLRAPTADVCPICAARLGPGAAVSSCAACPLVRPHFVAARAGVLYAGLGGELVRRAKYGRDPLYALPLAARLVVALDDWAPARRATVVVPVPTTLRRRKERGFNLAEFLAEPVARSLGLPLRHDVLRRVGEPPPQAALTRAERRRAASGTVRVAEVSRVLRLIGRADRGIRGGSVLLVDDVLTTGATANASAVALLRAGARSVAVAVATRA